MPVTDIPCKHWRGEEAFIRERAEATPSTHVKFMCVFLSVLLVNKTEKQCHAITT